ncbi:zinc-dependent peptidase [Verminephrobacter aporrectodeae subsp. tuberculatae]|uniref:M90 family metallopeptidase n=1 Tax=Verminephrobacter aporrectodeae TaxID=1110389 RepID=UPI002243E6BF|nr:M90 family metallopeptidase [Verminephrobacter aporrectodeae]MCW8163782.1 zinc-dependent peptidase [Verminephrobacter aporrectodeae subsp. tuberculatae]MCW8168017.1 zinc-dependent peptidase [Verminephrobacter aporrectodeae subsp. tuberculatae]
MPPLVRRLWHRVCARVAPRPEIPSALWLDTLQRHPFLAALPLPEKRRLRTLSALFLRHKEFHGVHGLVVSDAMAVDIAAQACLPLLHWGTPARALDWYGDFVGIVLHPDAALARRQTVDAAGVVHTQRQVLLGEAMERGPVMLSWQHSAHTDENTARGANLVLHEFVHKLDMRSGQPDGCPPLPAGFLGTRSFRAARQAWWAVWEPAYAQFRERVTLADRFGAERPWLDAYGAAAPAEFFAVSCEAYFVNRQRFAQDFPTLIPLLDAFFKRPADDPPQG